MLSRANRKKFGENLLQCHSAHHEFYNEIIRERSRDFEVRSHPIKFGQTETSKMSKLGIGYFKIAPNP
jgi:hypothetical protein